MLPRTWLCDPDFERCVAHRSALPDVKILNSTRLGRLKEGPERRAASLSHHGIDGVNMHRTDWNGGLVALFHRFNLSAFSWDLQFDDHLETAFRMGLDAVFSDHVDIMMDAFQKQIGGPIPS
jgi:glycerophosphoryl diester phosphodiesterase